MLSCQPMRSLWMRRSSRGQVRSSSTIKSMDPIMVTMRMTMFSARVSMGSEISGRPQAYTTSGNLLWLNREPGWVVATLVTEFADVSGVGRQRHGFEVHGSEPVVGAE